MPARGRSSGAQVTVRMIRAATELVAEAVVCLAAEMTVEELVHTIHAHPTLSEAVHESAESVLGHAIHLPPTK